MTVFLALVLPAIFFFYFSIGQNKFTYLDDTAIMAEANYSVNIMKSKKKICLSLNYNARNSFLYVKNVKI